MLKTGWSVLFQFCVILKLGSSNPLLPSHRRPVKRLMIESHDSKCIVSEEIFRILETKSVGLAASQQLSGDQRRAARNTGGRASNEVPSAIG